MAKRPLTRLATPVRRPAIPTTPLASDTVRTRIGYAPCNWLFYATGGFGLDCRPVHSGATVERRLGASRTSAYGLGRGGGCRISDLGPLDWHRSNISTPIST